MDRNEKLKEKNGRKMMKGNRRERKNINLTEVEKEEREKEKGRQKEVEKKIRERELETVMERGRDIGRDGK